MVLRRQRHFVSNGLAGALHDDRQRHSMVWVSENPIRARNR
jgi:hypothetical protein